MRFDVINIGCKVNRVEVDAAAAALMANGATLTHEAPLDVVVMNTCTVTAEADKKTRKAVRQALRSHPEAAVLVTGCAAVMNPSWFEKLDGRVHVVAKNQVASAAWDYVSDLPCPTANADALLRTGVGFRTRVGIKAQDGCNNACTYCIVHVARGESRSMPFESIVEEACAHSRADVRELVLTGINLGAYKDRGRTLADLFSALLEACPETRFRIGSIEPRDVDDALIDLIAQSDGRICRHLHLPLQSGSSRVLREMARPYDAPFFLDLVPRMRAAFQDLRYQRISSSDSPGKRMVISKQRSMWRANPHSRRFTCSVTRREREPPRPNAATK